MKLSPVRIEIACNQLRALKDDFGIAENAAKMIEELWSRCEPDRGNQIQPDKGVCRCDAYVPRRLIDWNAMRCIRCNLPLGADYFHAS